MSRRRGHGGRREPSLLTNPILVGALTVLVTIVAVSLAYNATNGLPFVPTYTLHVRIADAEELQHGDDVTIGGSRVGFVSSVVPVRLRDGRPIALLNLDLYRSVQPLPLDTTFTVRLKGAIGLKYLAITPGTDRRSLPDNATVPLTQSSSDVDFDQVLSMFNPPTRVGTAESTVGFGEALTGRGGDLNNAIGAFVPLLGDLTPVARNLSAPGTHLAGFFDGLQRYAAALSPVAQTQASLFGNLDTTFRSLASVAPDLQSTISATPPAFSATISGAPAIEPFLTDTASLFATLRPGVETLPRSVPVLDDALAIGNRTLPGTAGFARRTASLSHTLGAYSTNPSVQQGLDRLTLTMSALGPPLAFLTPAQTSCNYVTLFLRNTSSLLSEHVSEGTLLRFVEIAITDSPGYESEPSSHVYTGAAGPASGPLHVNPYPYTDAPGEPAECSAGNEHYDASKAQLGNPPGKLGLSTEPTKADGG